MKTKNLIPAVLVTIFLLSPWAIAGKTDEMPERIRIGVDVRLGLQSCLDYWTPVTDYLTKAIPGHRFVIVPLASQQDLVRLLESKGVDFMALDPAMELMAEDRFGTVPLATMTEIDPKESRPQPSDAASNGAIIFLADRSDIRSIKDLRGLRISAVKPWSLTGWISQWGLLANSGIDPHRDIRQVIFEGTHGQVIQRVLDESADVGIVDADILSFMMHNGRIAPDSFAILNRDGRVVPLGEEEFVASTQAYPGRLFSKAEMVPDEFAKRVADALTKTTLDSTLDGMPCRIRWTAPCNYSRVRHLLQTLMGPQFAESEGFPLPRQRPAWLFPLQITGIAIGFAFLASAMVRRYYRRSDQLLQNQLDDSRRELIEVQAELQRMNVVLDRAGCGIDIVDDENNLVYVDSNLEHRYGDWHNRKCHEYYCESDAPCPECRRPFPINEHCGTAVNLDCTEWTTSAIARAKHQAIEGKAMWMIGVPFRDEGGRWLHARLHIPEMKPAELAEIAVSAGEVSHE